MCLHMRAFFIYICIYRERERESFFFTSILIALRYSITYFKVNRLCLMTGSIFMYVGPLFINDTFFIFSAFVVVM